MRNNWTEFPLPNDGIDTIHRLAAASKQSWGITFTNKDGNIITDDDDTEEENVTDKECILVTGVQENNNSNTENIMEVESECDTGQN